MYTENSKVLLAMKEIAHVCLSWLYLKYLDLSTLSTN